MKISGANNKGRYYKIFLQTLFGNKLRGKPQIVKIITLNRCFSTADKYIIPVWLKSTRKVDTALNTTY